MLSTGEAKRDSDAPFHSTSDLPSESGPLDRPEPIKPHGNVNAIGFAFIDADSDGIGSTPDRVFTSSSETTAQV